jgi:ribosomal protein S18 acetylase RimI-like enzyme
MSIAPLQLRPVRTEDLPRIKEIQAHYLALFPDAISTSVEGYRNPRFADAQNIFCAFETEGRMVGYAPLIPSLAESGRGSPMHVIWADIKVDPAYADVEEIRRCLLACVEAHARRLVQSHPERRTQLVFQLFPSEEESLSFLISRGFVHIESVFQLSRDLAQPVPILPPPPGMEVHPWPMQTQVEQRCYVEAYNQAYSDTPLTLQDWQFFMQSPLWSNGTCLAAFDQGELAGSIMLLWDGAGEAPDRPQTGLTENVFVLPRWRGLGLGAHLISQGLLLLRKHGLKEAQVQVKESNTVALGLYTGLGYQVAREIWLLAATL